MAQRPTIGGAEWRVSVGLAHTTVLVEPPLGTPSVATFVFAHGAGGHKADAGMQRLAETFHALGITTARFNFLYREGGSRRPDPMPLLEECIAAVTARVREELHPTTLLLGGRSMGGRAASMLAAKGYAADGLLLLAYPLHPAGQPHKLRDAHLSSIDVPVLCFNGTRDALCREDLMDAALRQVRSAWTMHWLRGADHSFHVLKSSGRTDTDVLKETGEATATWLARLHSLRATPENGDARAD